MKKIPIAISLIFLVGLDMWLPIEYSEAVLGAVGILQLPNIKPTIESLGLLCFPIGFSYFITYFYAKLAAKNQVNIKVVSFWMLVTLGILFALIYFPDQVIESFF